MPLRAPPNIVLTIGIFDTNHYPLTRGFFSYVIYMVIYMSNAFARPSRPTGVIKHTVTHPDGSVTIRSTRTDKYGVTRRHSVTVVPNTPAR